MAKKSTTAKKNTVQAESYAGTSRTKTVIFGLVYIALGVFIFAAMQFEVAGAFGNHLGQFLKGIFSLLAMILPWYLVVLGVLLIGKQGMRFSKKTWILTIIILLLLCLINAGRFIDADNVIYTISDFYTDGIKLKSGGLFGMTIGSLLVELIGKAGLYIFSLAALAICLFLLLHTPISSRMKQRAADNYDDDYDLLDEPKKGRKKAGKEAKSAKASKYSKDLDAISDKDYADDITEEDYKIYTEPEAYSANLPEDYDFRGTTGIRNANGKSNVVEFMNSNDPFGDSRTENSGSYGLEQASHSSNGYGLDGANTTKGGTGLDGMGNIDSSNSVSNSVIKDPGKLGKAAALGAAAAIGVGATAASVAGSGSKAKKSTGLVADDSVDSFASTIEAPKDGVYHKPPIELLNKPQNHNEKGIAESLNQKARILEETLKSFNVDAKVVQVTKGPTVTRFEIQPGVGVKVNKITNLADDIALNLRAKSIRVEAPIPGKAVVGIEVENEKSQTVTARELIDSREFKTAKSKISFAVGKDIAGNNIIADLKGMPHLLIAGSTGSGKSVCINMIITSLIYKADPDEVKLILIDPKVVELGNYNGIPHLLIPVVTEATKAAQALSWAVAEMTNRYKAFAENGVRDLESYNRKMKRENQNESVMPQVVIIIDELADLMMQASKQVEDSIVRLGQLARAAGMHLIVATQRPSVDVITGLIKANIPSRIAFAVSSGVDSRTILDKGGAEKLVGKGDMFFAPLGSSHPLRVQGPFISDEEINRVIDYVKSQNLEQSFSQEAVSAVENGLGTDNGFGSDVDELLPDAIEAVVLEGHASTSMIQRRFRIGYNRAARIMDDMEARGIIGPQDGSRPRQVLMTPDELEELKGN